MRISEKIIKYRVPVIALTLLVVLLSVIPLFKVRINSDLESYFPERMSSRRDNEKIRMLFQRNEKMVLILDYQDVLDSSFLERLSGISSDIKDSPLFGEAVSLTTVTDFRGQDGLLVSNPLIEKFSFSPEEKDSIRSVISSKKFILGKIVSKNFTKALIVSGYDSKASDSEVIAELERIIKKHPGEGRVIYTGLPLLREEANTKIGRDLILLLPLAVLAMLLLLTLFFRDISAVLLPFSVVLFSTLFAMALIPVFGWELSIIGILVPVMMISIANNYGIHFVSRYQELLLKENESDSKAIAANLLNYLWKPVLICGLTTIAGILGLVTHILDPARQMGVVTSVSVGFALLLSLLFIPAVISFFKVKKRRERTSPFANSKGYNILEKVASNVTFRTRNTIIVFVAIIVISALSILLLKVSPDSGNILPKEHPYSKGADILDNEFHGSKYISLMISGDIVTPELYKSAAALQKRIESIQGVGGVISITDILVEIGKALNDPGDTLYGKLPPNREMAAQYLELFAINSSPGEIENYLDFDYKKALMTVQYSSPTMKDARSTLGKIYKEVKSSGLEVTVGGYSLIEYQMSRSVVKGQYWSLLFAFAVIFLLLSGIFKSPFAGVLGSLPLLFAVIVTFGFMGLANIELNIVTALISSVSIGLGVDFTIHLFWRIRSESFAGKELREAVITSVTNAGRGIAVNAFSVMAGFSVLFASGFPLIRNFALMIILSLFLCLASALLLVPALTIVIKPKFLTSYKK